MFHKSRMGLACLVVLGLICGSLRSDSLFAEEPATYRLRFKFAPQQTLYYVSQNDADYFIEHSNAQETVLHTSMSLRKITVLGVDADGTADVQLMIDRAYMTANNAGVDSVYDSTQVNHVPTEFSGVHQSIGKSQKARLTQLGQVLPSADKSASVEQVDLLFRLPEQPVAIGGKWKDQYDASILAEEDAKLFRQIKMQRRFELLSVDQGIATIAVSTVCLSPISDSYQESQLVQRKPSGILKFDIEQGCLVDRQLKIDDKTIGHQGPGSALTVKIVKVDRLVNFDQLKLVDLTKPLVPVRVAAAAEPATK